MATALSLIALVRILHAQEDGMAQIPTEVVAHIDWQGYALAGVSPGPRDTLCVLLRAKQKSPNWRVLVFSAEEQHEYGIHADYDSFGIAQPLPEGFLLADPYPRDSEDNVYIFDHSGRQLRSFYTGDGIYALQTTEAGDIWAACGYHSHDDYGMILGADDLVQLSAQGVVQHQVPLEQYASDRSGPFALNVESDELVWWYSGEPCPLVRMRRGLPDTQWDIDFPAGTVFAVWANTVLLDYAQDASSWMHMELDADGQVRRVQSVEFTDEDGDALPSRCATARGRLIWFSQNSKIYRADISRLL